MPDNKSTSTHNTLRVVPFTGPIFAIWAFFWPESFGLWFGTIIHAVRSAGGF